MGTRSLTSIYDTTWSEKPKHKMTFYRHSDGYPAGHGQDIADFLEGRILINGVPNPAPEKFSNGVGRLGTELLIAIHQAGHDPELVEEGTTMGQEYHYVITGNSNAETVKVEVFEGPMTGFGYGGDECKCSVFAGTISEYVEWVKTVD